MNGLFNLKEQLLFLDVIPFGLVFMNPDSQILLMNQSAEVSLQKSYEEAIGCFWHEMFPNLQNLTMASEGISRLTIRYETYMVQKKFVYRNYKLEGYLLIFQNTPFLMDDLNLNLQDIVDSLFDVIYVSDGKGNTLRVSSSSEKLLGYRESELVGRNVYDLEQEGIISPSITRLVLEKKEKVSSIQTTKTGRRLKVVGTPIKNEEGQIIRIVNASQDITDYSPYQLADGSRRESIDIRAKQDMDVKYIFRSAKMKKVIGFLEKIAKVDSPVLLIGESGVGKEVIASSIHKWSARAENPFITVNCGAISEALLEAELFGYEEGTLTSKDGCIGAIEMAHGGTLFLDDIDSMPLTLQAKLLRVIQEMKISRIGAMNSTPVDVRIVTATSSDLAEGTRSGTFRRDLYYLLNVIPTVIPPLRDRKEDIIPLILHHTKQLNRKYGVEKKFNPRLLKKLQEYPWPGNLRELRNIIERLLVSTEGNWIETEHLPEYITTTIANRKCVQVNAILPLKEAVETLEKELLELAQEKYGSTTKIAQVLGVNQSTICRKLQYYKGM